MIASLHTLQEVRYPQSQTKHKNNHAIYSFLLVSMNDSREHLMSNVVHSDQVEGPISEGAGLSTRGCLEGDRPKSGEKKKKLNLCPRVPGTIKKRKRKLPYFL